MGSWPKINLTLVEEGRRSPSRPYLQWVIRNNESSANATLFCNRPASCTLDFGKESLGMSVDENVASLSENRSWIHAKNSRLLCIAAVALTKVMSALTKIGLMKIMLC